MIKILLILGLFFLYDAVSAAEIPVKLFGITLGGVYDLGDESNDFSGNVPQQKFAGIKQGVGPAIHYYFQPNIILEKFEYVEKRSTTEQKYFETSFKLYLFPSSRTKPQKQHSPNNTWVVYSIDWSNNVTTKREAYQWAKERCRQYAQEFDLVPEITDFAEADWYECRYASGNRVFDVGGMSQRINISLRFRAEEFSKKEKSFAQ